MKTPLELGMRYEMEVAAACLVVYGPEKSVEEAERLMQRAMYDTRRTRIIVGLMAPEVNRMLAEPKMPGCPSCGSMSGHQKWCEAKR